MPTKATRKSSDSTANLGFEAKLWLTADKLRNNMDAAEYKHLVLGLILLRYISDRLAALRDTLLPKLLSGKLIVASVESAAEFTA